MKAAGANITINTDTVLFRYKLNHEYELYHKYFDSSVRLYAHNKTAIEAHLLVIYIKEELLKNWLKPIHGQLLDWCNVIRMIRLNHLKHSQNDYKK